MRILHIEDDPTLRFWVKTGLSREGFAVDGAAGAKEGVQMACENTYDIILLDIAMPDHDGFWALRTLRQSGQMAAIFMISGQAGEPEKLMAFEAGADDYMVKPIFITELVARIRVWLKRQESVQTNPTAVTEVSVGALHLDFLKHRATIRGRQVSLTPKEFMVLEYLMRRAGRLVTQTALSQAVWNQDFETSTNVVEVHINRLRKKIDEDGKPSLIQTVRGSGYLLEIQ